MDRFLRIMGKDNRKRKNSIETTQKDTPHEEMTYYLEKFLQLPADVLILCFCFLPLRDIMWISRANKYFHSLTQKRFLWERLYLRDYEKLHTRLILEEGGTKKHEINWKELYHSAFIFQGRWHPTKKNDKVMIVKNGKSMNCNATGKWVSAQIGLTLPEKGKFIYYFQTHDTNTIFGVVEDHWNHNFDGGVGFYPGTGFGGVTECFKSQTNKEQVYTVGNYATFGKEVKMKVNMNEKTVYWKSDGKKSVKQSFVLAKKPVIVICSILQGEDTIDIERFRQKD